MKPNIQLDTLIAEKVFGWKKIPLPDKNRELEWMWDRKEGCFWYDAQTVPPYSTDPFFGWEVVTKLRELFPYARLNLLMTNDDALGPGLKYEFSIVHYMGMGDFFERARCVGDSVPEAICMAALKAVEST